MPVNNTRAAVSHGEVIRKNGQLSIVRKGHGAKSDDVLMATSPDFAVLGNSRDLWTGEKYKDLGKDLYKKYMNLPYQKGDPVSDISQKLNEQNMNQQFDSLMQRQKITNELTGKTQQYKNASDTDTFQSAAYGDYVPRYGLGGWIKDHPLAWVKRHPYATGAIGLGAGAASIGIPWYLYHRFHSGAEDGSGSEGKNPFMNRIFNLGQAGNDPFDDMDDNPDITDGMVDAYSRQADGGTVPRYDRGGGFWPALGFMGVGGVASALAMRHMYKGKMQKLANSLERERILNQRIDGLLQRQGEMHSPNPEYREPPATQDIPVRTYMRAPGNRVKTEIHVQDIPPNPDVHPRPPHFGDPAPQLNNASDGTFGPYTDVKPWRVPEPLPPEKRPKLSLQLDAESMRVNKRYHGDLSGQTPFQTNPERWATEAQSRRDVAGLDNDPDLGTDGPLASSSMRPIQRAGNMALFSSDDSDSGMVNIPPSVTKNAAGGQVPRYGIGGKLLKTGAAVGGASLLAALGHQLYKRGRSYFAPSAEELLARTKAAPPGGWPESFKNLGSDTWNEAKGWWSPVTGRVGGGIGWVRDRFAPASNQPLINLQKGDVNIPLGQSEDEYDEGSDVLPPNVLPDIAAALPAQASGGTVPRYGLGGKLLKGGAIAGGLGTLGLLGHETWKRYQLLNKLKESYGDEAADYAHQLNSGEEPNLGMNYYNFSPDNDRQPLDFQGNYLSQLKGIGKGAWQTFRNIPGNVSTWYDRLRTAKKIGLGVADGKAALNTLNDMGISTGDLIGAAVSSASGGYVPRYDNGGMVPVHADVDTVAQAANYNPTGGSDAEKLAEMIRRRRAGIITSAMDMMTAPGASPLELTEPQQISPALNPYGAAMQQAYLQNMPDDRAALMQADAQRDMAFQDASRESNPILRAAMRQAAGSENTRQRLEARHLYDQMRQQGAERYAAQMAQVGAQDAAAQQEANRFNAEARKEADMLNKKAKAALRQEKEAARDRFIANLGKVSEGIMSEMRGEKYENLKKGLGKKASGLWEKLQAVVSTPYYNWQSRKMGPGREADEYFRPKMNPFEQSIEDLQLMNRNPMMMTPEERRRWKKMMGYGDDFNPFSLSGKY